MAATFKPKAYSHSELGAARVVPDSDWRRLIGHGTG
jgi:hypothetical protein